MLGNVKVDVRYGARVLDDYVVLPFYIPLGQPVAASGQAPVNEESNPACHSGCWEEKVLLNGLQFVQENTGMEEVLSFSLCVFFEEDLIPEMIGNVLAKGLPVARDKGFGWRQPMVAQEIQRMCTAELGASQTVYLPYATVNAAQGLPSRQ